MRIAVLSCGLLLFLSTSQLLSQQSKGNGEPPISLRLATDTNPVKVGAELKVTVTVKNETQESVVIADGQTDGIYKVDMRDSFGRPVPERDRYRFWSIGGMKLAPGETHQDEIVLSHMYDLSRPGTYVVVVRRNSRVEPESGTENATSNILVINVTETEPSDPRSPLDQKVQKFKVDDGALIDGVSELSRNPDVKLHIGVEEIIRKRVMDPKDRSVHFSLRLENQTVRDLLDTLCQADARYTWSMDGGTINIYPRASIGDPSYLLNIWLDSITVTNIPDPDQALMLLAKQVSNQQIGYGGAGGNNAYTEPWTTSFERLTVRQFTNRIAEHIGPRTSWVWSGGEGERMFTFLKGGFN
jgi:hypothetical protein